MVSIAEHLTVIALFTFPVSVIGLLHGRQLTWLKRNRGLKAMTSTVTAWGVRQLHATVCWTPPPNRLENKHVKWRIE